MHSRLQCGSIALPGYGTMVIIGVLTVCAIASLVAIKRNLSFDSIAKFGIFGGVSAVLGAKLYSVLLLEMGTGFTLTLTPETIKSAGYSFMGGMPLGLIGIWVCCLIYKIDFARYMNYLAFEIPLLNSIWKVGCHLGGCCYGIEYDGRLAISFPEGGPAPANALLFPIQLTEAAFNFLLAIVLYIYGNKKEHALEMYLLLYGLARVPIEFLRYKTLKSTLVSNIVVSFSFVIAAIIMQYAKKRDTLGGNPCE